MKINCNICLESFEPNNFITYYHEDRAKEYFIDCPYCETWIKVTEEIIHKLEERWLSKKKQNVKKLIREADLRGELNKYE